MMLNVAATAISVRTLKGCVNGICEQTPMSIVRVHVYSTVLVNHDYAL